MTTSASHDRVAQVADTFAPISARVGAANKAGEGLVLSADDVRALSDFLVETQWVLLEMVFEAITR